MTTVTTDPVQQAADNAASKISGVTDAERNKANADFSDQVKQAAIDLRYGFATGRPKKGEYNFTDDVLDRQIIAALVKDHAPDVELDAEDADIYDRAMAVLADAAKESDSLIDALATRLKRKFKNLALCATTRVTLRHGVPALVFAMNWANINGTKRDIAASMFNLVTPPAKSA